MDKHEGPADRFERRDVVARAAWHARTKSAPGATASRLRAGFIDIRPGTQAPMPMAPTQARKPPRRGPHTE